jgi:hypothetical protein
VNSFVAGGIVGADGGAGFAPDVGGLVSRERHGNGGFDSTFADLVAVDVQSDGAALGEAPPPS